MALTFLLVMLGSALFRGHDMAHAGRYYAALLGFVSSQPATALLWSLLFQPYHVLCLLAGAIVIWGFPKARNFTERQTAGKTVRGCALFLLSIVLLATQQYNPFIYFLF